MAELQQVWGRSDGSFLSSGTWQTGSIDRPVSRPINITEHTSQWSSFAMPPGFLDTSSGPGGGPGGVPVGVQDPLMMLTQSMVDFLSRTAQGAGAVPPLPGA